MLIKRLVTIIFYNFFVIITPIIKNSFAHLVCSFTSSWLDQNFKAVVCPSDAHYVFIIKGKLLIILCFFCLNCNRQEHQETKYNMEKQSFWIHENRLRSSSQSGEHIMRGRPSRQNLNKLHLTRTVPTIYGEIYGVARSCSRTK